MSHGCDTDVVPFVVHNIFEGSMNDLPDNDLVKLAEFDQWAEQKAEEADDEPDEDGEYPELPDPPADVRGWVTDPTVVNFGRKNRFFVQWVSKGEHKVVLINESQYSNVGEYEEAVCASDKASIEAFLEDFKDCLPKKVLAIEENDAVQQWG